MDTDEIMQARITFQIINPLMDLSTVGRAASQLDEMLAPSLLDQVAEPAALPGSLLQQPPIFQRIPTALFCQNPKLGVAAVPQNWLEFYLAWAARLKRSRQLSNAIASMQEGKNFDSRSATFQDPLVASLLLFAFTPAPDSELRRTLFEAALKAPLGACVCSESLYTTSERSAIAAALLGDSLAVLSASRTQDFAGGCLRHAMTRHDLASGLVVAKLGSDADLADWLRAAWLTACEETAAATAMLVLNPTAPKGLRSLWLATLQCGKNAAEAYSTVHWCHRTWGADEWSALKATLKPVIVSDGKAGWFNWFFHVEPDEAAKALTRHDADALWSFELLHVLNLSPGPLRFRLADRLGRLTYDWEANLVLAALERRERLKRKGDLDGTAL